MRRRIITIMVAIGVLVAPALVVPAASAVGETVTIEASASPVPYGEAVTIAGSVSGDPVCLGPRAVQIEWRAADSAEWAIVGSGQTATDGTFALSSSQQYTGDYRATFPADPSCAAVASNTALVRVWASVDVTLVAGSLVAGSCVDVEVSVSPAKPGQDVELQRRTTAGWTTTETLTLDDLSRTSARPCFGWEDIGLVRLRARWPVQDPLNAIGTSITLPFQIGEAPWMERIGALTSGRATSVAVGREGVFLFERADAVPRAPASNEKLLLSMTLLDTLGVDHRIVTRAASADSPADGVLDGDLWILGRGDPEIRAARLGALAGAIEAAGVAKIRGSVMGSTSFFRHDWWATGWERGVTRDYVAPPTALSFEGNLAGDSNVTDPERRAAASLTAKLEALGVAVGGKAGAGRAPDGLVEVASIASRPLRDLLTGMNRPSDNFYAEVLGKVLGAQTAGTPGTIAKGAAAIRAWAAGHDVEVTAHDGSGLSYEDRVTAEGIVRLLWVADGEPWGRALRFTLPRYGQGTLRHRSVVADLRAKTGTLDGVSALSGWVWLEREDAWAEFSILSRGMTKATASDLEDRIVRIIANFAR